MKRPNLFATVSLLALTVAVAAGCKKNTAPEPVALEQAPVVLEQAFKDAKPELKAQADQAVATLKNEQDAAKALSQLRTLIARTELTPEQRAAATCSLLAVQQHLQTAAAKGDPRATEALQKYGSTR